MNNDRPTALASDPMDRLTLILLQALLRVSIAAAFVWKLLRPVVYLLFLFAFAVTDGVQAYRSRKAKRSKR